MMLLPFEKNLIRSYWKAEERFLLVQERYMLNLASFAEFQQADASASHLYEKCISANLDPFVCRP